MRQSELLGPMRLPFLVLPPACVLLGLATATWTGARIDFGRALLVLFGALSAHVSVNALNEYSDFTSGLDFHTERTPFSGGSGTLPRNPHRARSARITGWGALIATVLVGCYFVVAAGPGLLPIGILGVITIVAYTDWITRRPWLCLLAPGVGFGPLMVMGTDFVLSGGYSATAAIASAVPFFLVSDLLLLNQFPDLEPDRAVGRRHIGIVFGKPTAVALYALFLGGAYGAIGIGCLAGILPPAGLIGLGTVVLAVPTIRGVKQHADDIPRLIPYMGKNVVITIATPVLLAIGLLVG